MARGLFLVYGIVAYLLFVAAIVYAIGFIGNIDASIELGAAETLPATDKNVAAATDAAVPPATDTTVPPMTDPAGPSATDAAVPSATDPAAPLAAVTEELPANEFRIFPKTIDGPMSPATTLGVIAIDLLLLGAFALQHNVMARPRFKKLWTRLVPQAIERSTFVAASSLLLLLLYWQWRPIPEPLWNVESAPLRAGIWTLYGAGWLLVFYSTFVIDHFELFGLKQVVRNYRGLPEETAAFSSRSLYRWVRHPLMLGFLIAFWAAPTMTLGRLLFAGVCTAWILFSIVLEERDLAHALGDPYREYRGRTSMILPLPRPSERQK